MENREKVNRWWRKSGKRFAKDRAFGELESLATDLEWMREQAKTDGEKFDKLMEAKNLVVASEASAQRARVDADRDTTTIHKEYEEYRTRTSERLACIEALCESR